MLMFLIILTERKDYNCIFITNRIRSAVILDFTDEQSSLFGVFSEYITGSSRS